MNNTIKGIARIQIDQCAANTIITPISVQVIMQAVSTLVLPEKAFITILHYLLTVLVQILLLTFYTMFFLLLIVIQSLSLPSKDRLIYAIVSIFLLSTLYHYVL